MVPATIAKASGTKAAGSGILAVRLPRQANQQSTTAHNATKNNQDWVSDSTPPSNHAGTAIRPTAATWTAGTSGDQRHRRPRLVVADATLSGVPNDRIEDVSSMRSCQLSVAGCEIQVAGFAMRVRGCGTLACSTLPLLVPTSFSAHTPFSSVTVVTLSCKLDLSSVRLTAVDFPPVWARSLDCPVCLRRTDCQSSMGRVQR